ncbi:hypothetical protein FJTKL_03347 [Diaporthe vaccinii]|uniref:Rhodopsin domain-containing protein n=1 Tax=Diaporthe vaccinii TaxID=105482 RepID=A0ABR4F1U4_9PEZI
MSTTDIMDMPAITPPPGVVPNFDDPPNSNTMALVIISVCLAVTTIAMVLRFYSRWAVVRMVQWQDYLLLVAFGIYIAMLAMTYRLSSEVGWFIHRWDLRARDVVEFLHTFIIGTYLFLGLLLFLKTAILMEWIHIFLPDGGNRRNMFFWACHFVIWANIIFCAVTAIIYSLSCVPYQYLWNQTIEGHCRVTTAYLGLSTACFVFATDIIILFIPQRVIWELNMSRSRKAGVSFVFALGMAACAASIVRLYYNVVCADNPDMTYHMSSMMLTAVGECACAILVLCVPAVPKAFTGLKLSGLLPSITSWGRLASSAPHGSSKEPRKRKYTGDGARTWPASAEEVYKRNWQVGSSSERSLVPLEPKSSARHHDLELGNAILCITDFTAKTSYDPDRTVFLEQRSRQHPWMQR